MTSLKFDLKLALPIGQTKLAVLIAPQTWVPPRWVASFIMISKSIFFPLCPPISLLKGLSQKSASEKALDCLQDFKKLLKEKPLIFQSQ